MIGHDGEQLGVVSLREALNAARERNLDLVEVAPQADPPVCKILDYGKFHYLQVKKQREAKRAQKVTEVKELRLRPKTDEHDAEVKSKQARRFLLAGMKVKVRVRFRGREITHPEIGREVLEEFATDLADVAVVEQRPDMEGRAMLMVLAPLPVPTTQKPRPKPAPKPAASAASPDGSVQVAEALAELSDGSAEAPDGSVEAPDGSAEAPGEAAGMGDGAADGVAAEAAEEPAKPKRAKAAKTAKVVDDGEAVAEDGAVETADSAQI